jgi:hypothetical protein
VVDGRNSGCAEERWIVRACVADDGPPTGPAII